MKKNNSLKIKKFSAQRDMHENWKAKALKTTNNDIMDTSIAWKDETARNALLSTTVSWPNFNVIQQNFEKIRDIRYYTDSTYPNFLRRIAWLYPDDGCWTRVSSAIKDLFGPLNNEFNYFPRPSK